MDTRLLADLTVLLHFSFVLFVVFGAFFAFKWRKVAWAHIPAFLWGGLIEIGGWVCPLTHLENKYRYAAQMEGYADSFVEHYILPLIYPELLIDGPFPREGFILIGVFVLVLNGLVYWRIWKSGR